MKIILTESQHKRLLFEQSFYPKGCNPGNRVDPHGHGYEGMSVKHYTNQNTYKKTSSAIVSLSNKMKSESRGDFKDARRDLMATMDGESLSVFRKMENDGHPFADILITLFAANVKSALKSYVPSGYNSLSAARITDYNAQLKNWITKLTDLGNGDYSWRFDYDLIFITKGLD